MIQSAAFWLVLAGAVPVFWLLPRPWRPAFLAAVSFGYLATLDPRSVAALAAWTVVFYAATPLLREGRRRRAVVLVGLILAILGFLAYFKYVPELLGGLLTDPLEARVLVPLGISYYTFKLVHYAAEVARGTIEDRSFPQFLCYLYLFPIFTAGPIERYDHFLAHQDDRWSRDSTVQGITRIAHGLIKKLVLGDILLQGLYRGAWNAASLVERLPEIGAGEVWASLGITYLYLYFDFSAYSDIAIGCSRLFGIRIMENFHYPVVARNIGDFWRRWHMTLSGWCQAYIYVPTIGLTRKPYLAAYASFTVLGLWHTAALVRILWALYHATGVLVFMIWTRLKRRRRWAFLEGPAARAVGIAVTQAFVVGSMAFLVAEGNGGVASAARLIAAMIPGIGN